MERFVEGSRIMNQRYLEWSQAWRRNAATLESLRRLELEAPDYYEKNRKGLDALLCWACAHAQPRASSGLIERQGLFRPLYARMKSARPDSLEKPPK